MRPLEGIRILDLSRLIPGSYCSLLLADLGAEVVKVEDPQVGDYGRQIPPFIGGLASRFLLLNRNKKSLALNLKSPEGRKIFLELAARSDVIIESFRPGTMGKFGLEYQQVREVNPRIIYCSISAYGQDGPWRDVVGHDVNILGISGLLDITGERGGRPIIPGVTIADNAVAMFSSLGILAAIIQREKTAEGQYLDMSMLDSVISWLFDSARYFFAEGKTPGKSQGRLWGGVPNYNIYQTKDGKYITIGALEQKFKGELLRKLGREDLMGDEAALTTTTGGEKQEELSSFLASIFLTKTQEEWARELEDLNICFAPVNTVGEAFSHPQVLYRKMLLEMDHPVAGRTKAIGTPLKLSALVSEAKPAPLLGQHTEDILRELGYRQEEIRRLQEQGVIGLPG